MFQPDQLTQVSFYQMKKNLRSAEFSTVEYRRIITGRSSAINYFKKTQEKFCESFSICLKMI